MNRIKKFLSGLVLAAMAMVPLSSYATGSYTVYNLPTMYLQTGISTTQTVGITIAAPYRNSATVAIPAMSGAVFQFTQNANQENIYAGRVAVDPVTSVITLFNVVRDLCFNQSISFTGCSTGRNFQKGAQIILTDDARLFNFKANIDRQNMFTSSGAVAFTGSGSFALPTFATTAARNQALGTNPGGPVRGACVTATNLCYLYIAGSWQSLSNGGIGNATTLAAGLVQMGTTTDTRNATITGSSGAPTVVGTNLVTLTSTGATQTGKIPALNANGILDSSLYQVAGSPFGNGSDGSGTINATTSLTRDMFYTNLTVGTGRTLIPNGYRIYVNNTLLDYGTIAQNGNTGSGGSAGQTGVGGSVLLRGGQGGTGALASNLAGSLPASIRGANGGQGSQGVPTGLVGSSGSGGIAGNNETSGVCVNAGSGSQTGIKGVAGGAGGTDGFAGGAGGAGGSSGSTTINNQRLFYNAVATFASTVTLKSVGCMAGSAGSGGGGSGGNNSGAGRSGSGGGGAGAGSNGGNVEIHAKTIIQKGNITANGGNGGVGGAGGSPGAASKGGGGGGGGGDGGEGGFITLIYNTFTYFSGSVSVAGGTPGAGGAAGAVGSGTPGSSGSNGSTGATGQVMYFQLK